VASKAIFDFYIFNLAPVGSAIAAPLRLYLFRAELNLFVFNP
jgi:hypothetical protein